MYMSKASFNKKIPGLICLAIVVALLSLPGSVFPSQNWMGKIYVDKWVHITLFFILTVSFCLPLRYAKQKIHTSYFVTYIILAALISITVGIIMEYIQKYFIPNRSFELMDIIADSAGSIFGCIFCLRWYKKINPDRHRGS